MPTKTRRAKAPKRKKRKLRKPDREIPLYVEMPPLSERPVKIKIVGREVAEPNPILIHSECLDSVETGLNMTTKTRPAKPKKAKKTKKRKLVRPEMELDLYVPMKPKSVRPVTIKILRRVRAKPNPILDYPIRTDSDD